jgi:hypothetical protein
LQVAAIKVHGARREEKKDAHRIFLTMSNLKTMAV